MSSTRQGGERNTGEGLGQESRDFDLFAERRVGGRDDVGSRGGMEGHEVVDAHLGVGERAAWACSFAAGLDRIASRIRLWSIT